MVRFSYYFSVFEIPVGSKNYIPDAIFQIKEKIKTKRPYPPGMEIQALSVSAVSLADIPL